MALGRPTTGELVVFKPKSHKKAGPFLRTSRLFLFGNGKFTALSFPRHRTSGDSEIMQRGMNWPEHHGQFREQPEFVPGG
ncbi:MAG: hypothetical protein ACO3FE_11115 [Planctomycetaceae bacterium]